jgi:uncharacterized protein
MKSYVLRLIAPRPTFMRDMTPEEGELMQAHVRYLRERMTEGKVVVFGPVLDASGPYGLVVAQLADTEAPTAIADNDPVIKSGRGFRYEISPMPNCVVR